MLSSELSEAQNLIMHGTLLIPGIIMENDIIMYSWYFVVGSIIK